MVDKDVPLKKVESEVFCDWMNADKTLKLMVQDTMFRLGEVVEENIAKEMKGKVGMILHDGWSRFGIHYLAIYSCCTKWIFNINIRILQPIVILEERNQPYPRCPKCDMFVSHKVLNGLHLAADFCQRGEERKRRCLTEEEAQAGAEGEAAITAYGIPLSPVTSFRYLRRFLSAVDNNWP